MEYKNLQFVIDTCEKIKKSEVLLERLDVKNVYVEIYERGDIKENGLIMALHPFPKLERRSISSNFKENLAEKLIEDIRTRLRTDIEELKFQLKQL